MQSLKRYWSIYRSSYLTCYPQGNASGAHTQIPDCLETRWRVRTPLPSNGMVDRARRPHYLGQDLIISFRYLCGDVSCDDYLKWMNGSYIDTLLVMDSYRIRAVVAYVVGCKKCPGFNHVDQSRGKCYVHVYVVMRL